MALISILKAPKPQGEQLGWAAFLKHEGHANSAKPLRNTHPRGSWHHFFLSKNQKVPEKIPVILLGEFDQDS